jgi:hypothetical protein
MRVAVTAVAALLFACRSQTTPPRGPHHDPVNSPEAESKCKEEWTSAKKAREELLGAQGDERRRQAAARAVLSQGRCEHTQFDRWRIDAGSQRIMAAELRAVRKQYLTANTLYVEAAGYQVAALELGAHASAAELHLAFARKLDQLPVPVDVQDPAARQSFRRDMRELMQTFEVEAALAASKALDAAARAPAEGAETSGWIRSSCTILATLDPEGKAGYPACRGGGGE